MHRRRGIKWLYQMMGNCSTTLMALTSLCLRPTPEEKWVFCEVTTTSSTLLPIILLYRFSTMTNKSDPRWPRIMTDHKYDIYDLHLYVQEIYSGGTDNQILCWVPSLDEQNPQDTNHEQLAVLILSSHLAHSQVLTSFLIAGNGQRRYLERWRGWFIIRSCIHVQLSRPPSICTSPNDKYCVCWNSKSAYV